MLESRSTLPGCSERCRKWSESGSGTMKESRHALAVSRPRNRKRSHTAATRAFGRAFLSALEQQPAANDQVVLHEQLWPRVRAHQLRVHVLDFTEFGDASDFRGIGADQAR